MSGDEVAVGVVLLTTFAMFMWGRWRYDAVALLALLALVLLNIVPDEQAFSGFGHPAVVTVAGVLVVSRGLQNSGAVDLLATVLARAGSSPARQVAATTGVVAMLSAFMNNVGALAVLMPSTIRLARSAGNRPSLLLMPLAFASLLGGLVTLVGTPPNIVIATFRANSGGEAFAMFDFAPVGVGIAAAGVVFISTIGWRLLPHRDDPDAVDDLFEIDDYLFEVRLPDGSPMVGETVRALGTSVGADFVVATLLRGEARIAFPSSYQELEAGDVLVVEGESDALAHLVDEAGLELVGSDEIAGDLLGSDEVALVEAVVAPSSLLRGRTARATDLRGRLGLNLLALSRNGRQFRTRVGVTPIRAGDVLLLQGRRDAMPELLATIGCLPLAERGLQFGQRERRALLAVAIFGGALLVAAALRLLPIQVAIVGAGVIMGLVGLVSPREIYESIDWTVIVLLGAMIPVGQALEDTGGAARFADLLLGLSGDLPTWAVLAAVMIVAMFLSDVVNNAAAAVLMAPIAARVADGVDASADPFLMAVALGASAAFLTPIGHQSNLLVMGPGGYRFGDYWRMGLPLEFLIVALGVPLIMLVWPP